MRVILLQDVKARGQQFDLIDLHDEDAMELLASRRALVWTKFTEKRFAGLVKDRTSPSAA